MNTFTHCNEFLLKIDYLGTSFLSLNIFEINLFSPYYHYKPDTAS